MPSLYCPYFCEENVWHLCGDPAVADAGVPIPMYERVVVFVTNEQRRIAMRRQRADPGSTVFWDYHVVLVARAQVWDLDTTIGFPVPLDEWAHESFFPIREEFAPRFRVIDAPTFRDTFASDRSHMRGPDGAPLKPFPAWPPIGRGMTLPRFIDLDTPNLGRVLDLPELLDV